MKTEMPYEADITIIGAGVVGLAIAAELGRDGREVYVVEKNEGFGRETSSHNSEVIHAGLYYPPGTLKAITCVEGNARLYQLGEKYGIGCKKLGKLIVATSDEEIEALEALLEKGRNNGVVALKLLSRSEVKKMEPHINAVAALFSPSTGIIDAYALMGFFAKTAQEKGAKIAYKSEVVGIEKLSGGYRLIVKDSQGVSCLQTRVVINSAGLQSDKIAQLAGIDPERAGYKLCYCKGRYFSVGRGKNKLLQRLVYPAPEPEGAGLGVHATLNLEGGLRLGPDAQYVGQIDYRIDESAQEAFYLAARRFLPFIQYDDLEPEMAGIRPKLQGPGEGFRDFIIRHEQDRGLPGFINLIGIESPGLTSSPAIARYVGDLIAGIL